jgi:DNA (cytosine-5)-methyltransferase 1
MKKQVHIRLDQETLKSIKRKLKNSKQTLQDYILKAIRNQEHDTVREDAIGETSRFKFIDLFAGIGGIRMAFENTGGKCVFSSEYDKYCQATYWANFHDVPKGDIKKIDEKTIPDHDILTGGFPCQPFSIAGVSKKNALGKAHGFLDKTQGTLFFDIVRIINEKRPKAFMLENVKNLMSHDQGKTFKVIIEALEKLEYKVYTKVLDGKYYVPQHRERTLIVGMDRKIYGDKELFAFPEPAKTPKKFHTILEEQIPEKYTLTDKLWNYLQKYAEKHRLKGNGFGFGMVDLNGVSRTLSARYYKDGSEILIPQKGKNPRRLTPRECARLQGFPDSFKIVVSDCQAYRQFGNSVVRPLMEAVAGKLVEAMGIKEKEKKYA